MFSVFYYVTRANILLFSKLQQYQSLRSVHNEWCSSLEREFDNSPLRLPRRGFFSMLVGSFITERLLPLFNLISTNKTDCCQDLYFQFLLFILRNEEISSFETREKDFCFDGPLDNTVCCLFHILARVLIQPPLFKKYFLGKIFKF